jgi:hypothetical protein
MSKVTITERRCARCGKIGVVVWPTKRCDDCTELAKKQARRQMKVSG